MKFKTFAATIITAFSLNVTFANTTILFIRHGEKPENGLGQLNCQGLNRALALPKVIESKIGKPDYLFAPNPSKQKDDRGTIYDYIRPLATIEPTAIYYSMPVNVQIGFLEDKKLISELMSDKYKNKTMLVAWEHHLIRNIVKTILSTSGEAVDLPEWKDDDFDSIYKLNISYLEGVTSIKFELDKENLNGKPKECNFN